MPKLDKTHVHSYVRSHLTDKKDKMVFKCADPVCNHTTLVKIKDKSILIGKASLCPECKITKFVLTADDLKRKTPKCLNCRGGQKAEEFRKTEQVLKNVLDDILGGMKNDN